MKTHTFAMTMAILLTVTLVHAEEGRWRFYVGPGVRTGMKVETTRNVPPLNEVFGGVYDDGFIWDDGNPSGTHDWGGGAIGENGVTFHRIYWDGDGLPSATDTQSMPGIVTSVGCDMVRWESMSLGAKAGFAGYFGLKSSSEGKAMLASDTFGFSGPPPAPALDMGDTNRVKSVATENMRVQADLIQFSLGPEFAWKPLSGLRLSVSPAVLLNVASLRLSNKSTAPGQLDEEKSSATKFLFGGGILGEVAYSFADNWSVGGTVGYEYVQKAKARNGAMDISVDFSAITVSAGMGVTF